VVDELRSVGELAPVVGPLTIGIGHCQDVAVSLIILGAVQLLSFGPANGPVGSQ
jgi:hypothetical protein